MTRRRGKSAIDGRVNENISRRTIKQTQVCEYADLWHPCGPTGRADRGVACSFRPRGLVKRIFATVARTRAGESVTFPSASTIQEGIHDSEAVARADGVDFC